MDEPGSEPVPKKQRKDLNLVSIQCSKTCVRKTIKCMKFNVYEIMLLFIGQMLNFCSEDAMKETKEEPVDIIKISHVLNFFIFYHTIKDYV